MLRNSPSQKNYSKVKNHPSGDPGGKMNADQDPQPFKTDGIPIPIRDFISTPNPNVSL